jgi:hypothetical protein
MTQEELEELVKRVMNLDSHLTIDGFWQTFKEFNINPEAEMWQIIETQRAFYCGAMAWLRMQDNLAELGKDKKNQKALWQACVNELKEFAEADMEMIRRDAGGGTIM